MSKRTDYLSAAWGPHVWKTIHYIAHAYPNNPTDQDKSEYQTLYKLLAKSLPCSSCSKHFFYLVKDTLTNDILSNREALIKWSYDMHNEVNKKLGKNSEQVNYSDFKDEYALFTNQCGSVCTAPISMANLKEVGSKYKNNEALKRYYKARNVEYVENKNIPTQPTTSTFAQLQRVVGKMQEDKASYYLETNGKYIGLPTRSELKLINLGYTNIPEHKMDIIIHKLNNI